MVYLSLTVDPCGHPGAAGGVQEAVLSASCQLEDAHRLADGDQPAVELPRRLEAEGARRPWRRTEELAHGQPLTYDISHSDEVFFIDVHGHERSLLEGPPAAPKGSIPATIYRFMSDTGHKNAASPPTTAWTQAQAKEVLNSLVG